MQMTLFTANCRQDEENTRYPNKYVIKTAEDLNKAVTFDHVCGKFKNNHRGKERFIESDVDVMDCDNDHSDNPDEWVTPESLSVALEDVCYAIVPSRNNMKVKGNKSPRPRFHVYFPHSKITDHLKCRRLKENIHKGTSKNIIFL